MKRRRIAIDGPAASGKSAVGSAVARALGFPFIDTGGIYRALTWLALINGISPSDPGALTLLAASVSVTLGPTLPDGETEAVYLNGLDATPHLRDEAVEQQVSAVSAVAGVRGHLVSLQRELADDCAVMAGRDIGSVVLPDAELKIYLDASAEKRAQRRLTQLEALGEKADLNALVEQMRRRDYLDSTRAVAPLQIADDAIHLHTDDISMAEVIASILSLSAERFGDTAAPCAGERTELPA